MDIAFVVMPFAELSAPASGASLLKAVAARAGFRSRIFYFNLRFLNLIGRDRYQHLSGTRLVAPLLGEWLFCKPVFGDRIASADQIRAAILSRFDAQRPKAPRAADRTWRRQRQALEHELLPILFELLPECDAFITCCVDEIRAAQPRVVGFTAMFNQTAPCLAVSNRLKLADPASTVAFGGAGCFGSMGEQLLRSFPWIDYVCTGEGDEVLPVFLTDLRRTGRCRPLPGLRFKSSKAAKNLPPQPVTDLDSLPTPDFDDYFEQRRRCTRHQEIDPPVLLLETSRGCWWGQKRQCLFCGLNGLHTGYRSKSADLVLKQLRELTRRHGVRKVQFTDNLLDTGYVESLFPRLGAGGLDIELHCEIKANLDREQLARLKEGKVTHVQPGIESLSSTILRLMRKGTNLSQNIQTLRWCEELGIKVSWSLLYGFPGEPAAEYAGMAELVPLLVHLPPPFSCRKLSAARFSPYFERARLHGITSLRRFHGYAHILPIESHELDRLTSSFDFSYADGRDPLAYTAPLRRAVQVWQAAWQPGTGGPPRLDARGDEGDLEITDSRPGTRRRRHRLQGLAAAVYVRCDRARTQSSLARLLGCHRADRIAAEVRKLVDSGLMLEDGERVLSLAVMRDRTLTRSESKKRRHNSI